MFALKGKNVHTEHETSVQPPVFATVSDTVRMFSANVFLDFSVCIVGVKSKYTNNSLKVYIWKIIFKYVIHPF